MEMVAIIIILLFSVILHEVAHGYMAYILGDPTAKYEGRLTLNPVPHIDPLGTIIIPLILVVTGASVLFGWAKPVPYNPYNLKGRYGEAMVAAAGPLTNIAIALVGTLLFRLGAEFFPQEVLTVCFMTIFVNLFLALLNLIPVPPLDGSKIVSSLLPVGLRLKLEEKIASFVNVNSVVFTIAVLLLLVFFLLDYVVLAVKTLTVLLTGGI